MLARQKKGAQEYTLAKMMTKIEQPSCVDAEIVRRAKNGDCEAREQIFRYYYRHLYRFVLPMVYHDEEEASDVTQDVFVRLFESLPTLRAHKSLSCFLFTIARNLCCDRARRRQCVQFESLNDSPFDGDEEERDVADPADTPDIALERDELQKRVREAVETLSPIHRDILAMHYFQGMEMKDIARALHIPIGTVKSRLARARAELGRKLRGYV
jgi:RNA polymerase sigma-70 factor (ECF subfamily)